MIQIDTTVSNTTLYAQVETMQLQRSGGKIKTNVYLACQQSLSIFVNGTAFCTLSCLGSDVAELSIGYLFGEGFLKDVSDLVSVKVCTSSRVDICLRAGTPFHPNSIQAPRPLLYKAAWSPERAFAWAEELDKTSGLYQRTRATHCCALDLDERRLYFCEDISRHCAIDKVIGSALRDGVDLSHTILYSSGRIPADAILKLARCQISVVVSKAVPTFEAVSMAKQYGITILSSVTSEKINLFPG